MNWVDIKRNCPNTYEIIPLSALLNNRELYEFFDNLGFYIYIKPTLNTTEEVTWEWWIKWYLPKNRWIWEDEDLDVGQKPYPVIFEEGMFDMSKKKITSRTQAEIDAFTFALSIYESKFFKK